MQYVEVAGVRVSKIGLGCWQFGSREWGYGRAYAGDEAIKITDKALDLGINLIDTAEIYGFGQSERIVGRAIAGRRGEAFVATKIWPLVLMLMPQAVGLAIPIGLAVGLGCGLAGRKLSPVLKRFALALGV